MDDYNEIYFLDDDDVRNRSGDRDHRPGQRVARPTHPFPRSRGRAVIVRAPQQVVTAPAAAPAKTGLFSGASTGQLVELATMVLAAIMPLPAAPVVQGEPKTDMTNQLAYTGALALHAKRDEQLRTIGALVGKLVG